MHHPRKDRGAAALGLLLCGFVMAAADGAAAGGSPPELRWSACTDIPEVECTGLEVPVDPDRPDGPQFTLRLGRLAALDPAQRKGMILFIPGGPGAGISRIIAGDNARVQHVDELRRQWDVVTFDPRGIEQSSPIRCDPDLVPEAPPPGDAPPGRADVEAIERANRAFFDSCVAASGDLMKHLSSIDTAADVERIRQALTPDEDLNIYGASYGSQYGRTYLERYGGNVKAMVLDGVMDHSIDFPTFIGRNVLSVQDAFDRFARWCERDSACALHGEDVGAAYDAVVAAAPAARMLVPQFLAAGPDPEFGWPAIAQMLAEVTAGDTSKLDALSAASAAFMNMASEDPELRAGKHGLFPGVICADYGPQRDYDALLAAGQEISRRSPRFAWRYWDSTPIAHGTAGVGDCIGWPFEARNPPHRLEIGSHPNVMVANTTHDSQTPMINALSVWQQIPDARLLLADVDGHQSLINSRCAFEAMARFFEDPKSVETTTLCTD